MPRQAHTASGTGIYHIMMPGGQDDLRWFQYARYHIKFSKLNKKSTDTMETTKRNDFAELTKLSLRTFLNIGQMAQYRYLYTLGKELQKDSPAQVDAHELAQNRDKMISHTFLAGLGIVGLLAFGIAGLISRE